MSSSVEDPLITYVLFGAALAALGCMRRIRLMAGHPKSASHARRG
jgi:hypothetical protein